MTWTDLGRAGWLRVRPLTTWPAGAMTPDRERRASQFSAAWGDTLELLQRELAHLGGRQVVLELAIDEGDVRLDGLPRARAIARHPGVVVSFESHHGPLRYAVDRFLRWQDNVRAVALGLEALRRVDRYGMTRSGEQYRGWVALPESTEGGSLADRGRRLIVEHGGVAAALRATHPDHGGDPADFHAVQASRKEDG